jgi:hypothetical protein
MASRRPGLLVLNFGRGLALGDHPVGFEQVLQADAVEILAVAQRGVALAVGVAQGSGRRGRRPRRACAARG